VTADEDAGIRVRGCLGGGHRDVSDGPGNGRDGRCPYHL